MDGTRAPRLRPPPRAGARGAHLGCAPFANSLRAGPFAVLRPTLRVATATGLRRGEREVRKTRVQPFDYAQDPHPFRMRTCSDVAIGIATHHAARKGVSRLRRWGISDAAYPGLTPWANDGRACGNGRHSDRATARRGKKRKSPPFAGRRMGHPAQAGKRRTA